MYLPVATQIPDCPGRIIRKAKSGTTYIYYQYGQRYNAEKRYAIPERACIGKLTEEDVLKIAGLMLAEVVSRIEALGISVEIDEKAAEALAREGFDPVYGARPLRRVITRRVEDSFAEAMLGGAFSAGDRVRGELDGNGGIRWEKIVAAA